MVLLEIRDLDAWYGRAQILFGVSLDVEAGEAAVLIGRNGAGKSTLLRLLGGIDQPDHGAVITDRTISWPVGLSGGFQGNLTARENVQFVCRIHGAHGEALRSKVRFVQEFAEIGDYFDLPMRSFSSGMRSRVAFGLSMAFDFDYYLIDEVMAVGDAQFKAKSKDVMLARLKQSNVILTSHNMGDIRLYCNVVLHVDQGRVAVYEDIEAGIRAYQGNATPA